MIAGVLLTGGNSTRMGVDKATLLVGDEPLAVRAARVLAAVCDPLVEVGDGVTSLRAVRETPPGGGPLAALVAGADAVGVAPVVLLACDMPFVDGALLDLLATQPGDGTIVPLADGRMQYGCARYGAAAIERARDALAAGERSFRRTFDGDTGIAVLEPSVWSAVAPAHAFVDLDTPEDLERFGLQPRR